MREPSEREAFAERMRLQLQSRYRGVEVSVDVTAFALRLDGAGVDVTLPLGPLHQACTREPERSAGLIADYVRRAERQLSPRSGTEVSPGRLLWCVRATSYLDALSRAAELVTRPLGAGMVAFIAEALPGSLMRGVPTGDLAATGLDEAVLAAFVERSGGHVLLAVPDRAEVLALPAALPSADRFRMRVVRAWRESLNPVSRGVLVSDGTSLRELERESRRRGFELLGWLRS